MEKDSGHDEDMRLASNESLDSTTASSVELKLDIGPRISQEDLTRIVNSIREMYGKGVQCANNGTTNMLTVPLSKENIGDTTTYRMTAVVKSNIDRLLGRFNLPSSTIGFRPAFHQVVNGPRLPWKRVPSFVP